MRCDDHWPIPAAARAPLAGRALCNSRRIRSLARRRHDDGIQTRSVEPANPLVLPRARTGDLISLPLWLSPLTTEASPLLGSKTSGALLRASLPCSAMNIGMKSRGLWLALALLVLSCCKPGVHTRNRLDEQHFPSVVLWAWERPEDLEFLDPHRYAVAFLAQTLVLKGDEVVFTPRHQPLKVASKTELIAVSRVESQKTTGQRAALTPIQRERLVTLIVKTLELNRV